jgi:hypothetical protein
MDRSLISDCTVINSSNEFVIELRQADVPIFALEILMITMGLINKLIIIFDEGINKLELRFDKKMAPGDKAPVFEKSGGFVFTLSANHLDYICAFLLRAYRDQMAEVNHIHIEGEKDGDAFDLTLLFENYVEPMTPKEASKLLGD